MQRSGIVGVWLYIYFHHRSGRIYLPARISSYQKLMTSKRNKVLEDKSLDEQNWWLDGERPAIIIGCALWRVAGLREGKAYNISIVSCQSMAG